MLQAVYCTLPEWEIKKVQLLLSLGIQNCSSTEQTVMHTLIVIFTNVKQLHMLSS